MSNSSFCAELQLLRACGRFHLASAEGQTAALEAAVAAVSDWPRWLGLARHHRLNLLAADALLRHLPQSLPTATVDGLKSDSLAAAKHTLAQIHALHEIHGAFTAASIAVVVLKGPPLAMRAYGNPALRPCRDLDLLIHPHHLPQAHQILLTLGFACHQRTKLSTRELTAIERVDKHLIYLRNGLAVELHWRLDTGQQRFPDALARKGLHQPDYEALSTGQLPVLPLEIRLLYLAFHGAKHGWYQLLWLLDPLAVLLRRPLPDWPSLEGLGQIYDQTPTWSTLLHLSCQMFDWDLQVPDDEHRQAVDRWIVKQFLQKLGDGSEATPTPSANEMFRWSFRLREDFWGRLVFVIRHLCVAKPADYDWRPLPAWAHPLYVVLRPLRLLAQRLGIGGSAPH